MQAVRRSGQVAAGMPARSLWARPTSSHGLGCWPTATKLTTPCRRSGRTPSSAIAAMICRGSHDYLVGSHIIVYRIESVSVGIVRVLHQRMSLGNTCRAARALPFGSTQDRPERQVACIILTDSDATPSWAHRIATPNSATSSSMA